MFELNERTAVKPRNLICLVWLMMRQAWAEPHCKHPLVCGRYDFGACAEASTSVLIISKHDCTTDGFWSTAISIQSEISWEHWPTSFDWQST